MKDPEHDETEAPSALLPVSPSTGLDPEVRQFIGRVMTGYESAHRTIRDMCETQARAAKDSADMFAKLMKMQLEVAEEREELISKRHKRDLEAKEAAERSESFRALTTDARTVVLLALKKYLGVQLSGNDTHGMQDFLKTMTPDQVSELLSEGRLQLSVAQRQLLGATIMSLNESESPKTETALTVPEAAE